MKFNESNLPSIISINYNNNCYNVPQNYIEPVVRSILAASAKYLKIKKNKEKEVALFVNKENESNAIFAYGAIVTFNKPEDEDENSKGSWNLSFTFDKSEIDEIEDKQSINNADFQVIFNKEAEFNGIDFNAGTLTDIIAIPMLAIKQFLDCNAKETETVSVDIYDLATASVAVENGEKVFSIEPSEILRQYIKDDSNS